MGRRRIVGGDDDDVSRSDGLGAVARSLQRSTSFAPIDPGIGGEAVSALVAGQRQVGVAVGVQVADCGSRRERSLQIEALLPGKPGRPAPKHPDQVHVTSGAGDFTTAGAGEGQVDQDQVGPFVPVQPSRGHVRGGKRRDEDGRLKPAARTPFRQVEFVSARAHQKVGERVAVHVVRRQGDSCGSRKGDPGRFGSLRLSPVRGPEQLDASRGQDRHVPASVPVQVFGDQVDSIEDPQVQPPRQQVTPFAAPEDADDVALRLSRKPRLPVQSHDLGPVVPVQIGDGHGLRAVYRKDSVAPGRRPAVFSSPDDGQQPARILDSAVVGTEDQVGVAVPVQVGRGDSLASLHRQRGLPEAAFRIHRDQGSRQVSGSVVGAVEDQVQEPVLVQVEAVDGADGAVPAHVEILAGGVQPSVGEVLKRVFDPNCLLCRLHRGKGKKQGEEESACFHPASIATAVAIVASPDAWAIRVTAVGPARHAGARIPRPRTGRVRTARSSSGRFVMVPISTNPRPWRRRP